MPATGKDELKTRVSRVILEAMLDKKAIEGWVETLAEVGRPPSKGQPAIDAKTRATAAKAGLDLLGKLIPGAEDSGVGMDLIQKLQAGRDVRALDASELGESDNGTADPD